VLWVDRLTPEEFKSGFGSHTPMFSGQTKCVRYYMNCTRALKLFSSIIQKQGYVVDADNKQVHLSDAKLKEVAAVCPSLLLLLALFSHLRVHLHEVLHKCISSVAHILTTPGLKMRQMLLQTTDLLHPSNVRRVQHAQASSFHTSEGD
jgi:hypothetical protein